VRYVALTIKVDSILELL